MLQVRAVRWDAVTCTAGLVSHTATATLTPTPSVSRTASATTTRTPSLTPSPASVCNIRTVAGTGTGSSTGDGGQATSATVNTPFGLLPNGSWLYITEEVGRRTRRLDLATGVITTYVGTGSSTGTYAGVAATSANLGQVTQPLLLPNGDFAVGSRDRCVLAGVTAATSITYVVAGTGTCLGAGAAASSGVAANATAFAGIRCCAAWGTDGVFTTALDNRVRLINMTTGACACAFECEGWLFVHTLDPPSRAHPVLQDLSTRGSTVRGRQALRVTVGLRPARC
jgi:hypothetical protein